MGIDQIGLLCFAPLVDAGAIDPVRYLKALEGQLCVFSFWQLCVARISYLKLQEEAYMNTNPSISVPAATFEMTGVSFSQNGNTLLSDIGLSVRGKRTGIVGRNGSGKTTFARVLSGLIKPDQGKVRVCGVDIANDRKAALRTVGILFQNPDHQIIFPTVEEELGFGLLQMGFSKAETEQQVVAVLDEFNKAHWAKAATCLLYTSPSPRDKRQSRMPSSA